MSMSRSEFLRSIAVGAGAVVAGEVPFARSAMAQSQKKSDKEKAERLSQGKVEEFVRVAHFDLDRTRSLLADTPALVNASWDWGGGDWETALGAAAHMGRRDIAEFLLQKEARLDIFAAAMLGKLEVVKSAVAAFPATPRISGPHGIPLITHARKGGEQAAQVVTYLESLRG